MAHPRVILDRLALVNVSFRLPVRKSPQEPPHVAVRLRKCVLVKR